MPAQRRILTKLRLIDPIRTHGFVGLMGAAAAITIIRSLLLATILTAADFALYAAASALGQFLSTFISLGLVEKTAKTFVQSVASNDFYSLNQDSINYRRSILWRGMLLTCFAVLLQPVAGISNWKSASLIVIAIAVSSALSGILASSLRALGATNNLAKWSMFRSIASLVFAAIAAWNFGWQAALIGELAGATISLLLFQIVVNRKIHSHLHSTNLSDSMQATFDQAPRRTDRSGFWLAIAFWLSAVPVYLDRWFLASYSSGSIAATYAIAAVLISSQTTLTGILVQKVGPDLIRLGMQGRVDDLRRVTFRFQIGIATLGIVGTLVFALILHTSLAEMFRAKYELTWPVCLALIFVVATHITQVTDWALMAQNKEALVSFGAFVFFTVVVGGFCISALLNLGTEAYLSILGLARIAQLAFSWICLRKSTGSPT